MSMIGNFKIVTNSEIETLLSNPDKIEEFLYPEDFVESEDEIDIDKAWHGIHYLLCGNSWEGNPPKNFIVSGGEPIGDIDVGYGPARSFRSTEVKEISITLQSIQAHSLRENYDSNAFKSNEIYPDIWDEPIEVCLDSYILTYFEELKKFIQKASIEDKGLIVFIN